MQYWSYSIALSALRDMHAPVDTVAWITQEAHKALNGDVKLIELRARQDGCMFSFALREECTAFNIPVLSSAFAVEWVQFILSASAKQG